MARIFKEDEYNAKRDEILDYALRLVYAKGYAQMTIQDILDGMRISRGALYHYFDSKQALLEALVDRMGREAMQALLPIVQDPRLDALEKFRRYFEAGIGWKRQQKELILSLLQVWYGEDNAFIRQKMTAESMKNTPRLLEPIIRQGMAEKVFTTRYPEQAAEIIVGILLSLSDTFVRLLLAPASLQGVSQQAETVLEAVVDAIERILGAPAGSLKVFGAQDFSDWLSAAQPMPGARQ
jgi:AcrR family transcriptional regulator